MIHHINPKTAFFFCTWPIWWQAISNFFDDNKQPMVNSASFPWFVKVLVVVGGGGSSKVVCYKFEGAAPHAVALNHPGDFSSTENGSVDETCKKKRMCVVLDCMDCSLIYTWALHMVYSMLLWCDNSWTAYQIPNLICSSRKLKSHCLHYNKYTRIKTMLATMAFTSTVVYLFFPDCVCREKAAGSSHNSRCEYVLLKSVKMIFSVSPPVQSTSPVH